MIHPATLRIMKTDQKELPDSKQNQVALIFSDKYSHTVSDDWEMLPNRCHCYHDNSKIDVFTPFQQVFLLFPLLKSGLTLNKFV